MNWEEKYNALAELVDGYRRERDEARASAANAYRRGAEAMREHIAEVAGRNAALEWVVELVRALPIPEGKP